tara:strand:- start:1073 stop:1285 length:213 start_codon:yes stop_codon:yes gene_type:complete
MKFVTIGVKETIQKRIRLVPLSFKILLNSNNKNPPTIITKSSKKITSKKKKVVKNIESIKIEDIILLLSI